MPRVRVIVWMVVVASHYAAAVGLCSGKSQDRRPSLSELAQAYAKAATADERRDVCVRAMDLGYIGFARPLKNVSRLCGQDFKWSVGGEKNGTKLGVVYFERGPGGDGKTENQGPPQGWRLDVEHRRGHIGFYCLSNVGREEQPHSEVPRQGAPSLDELAQAYANAGSAERRDLCIRAIDLGYIGPGSPWKNVAQLCGTDFKEDYPERKNGETYGIVRFMRWTGPSTVQAPPGWILVVNYRGDSIEYYYLTNAGKVGPSR